MWSPWDYATAGFLTGLATANLVFVLIAFLR